MQAGQGGHGRGLRPADGQPGRRLVRAAQGLPRAGSACTCRRCWRRSARSSSPTTRATTRSARWPDARPPTRSVARLASRSRWTSDRSCPRATTTRSRARRGASTCPGAMGASRATRYVTAQWCHSALGATSPSRPRKRSADMTSSHGTAGARRHVAARCPRPRRRHALRAVGAPRDPGRARPGRRGPVARPTTTCSSGDDGVWTVHVPGVGAGAAVRLPGARRLGPRTPGARFNPAKLLLDPYARAITGGVDYSGPILRPHRRSRTTSPDPTRLLRRRAAERRGRRFARRRRRSPGPVPLAETVLYELHVKGYTRLHPAVPEHLRGHATPAWPTRR